MSGPATEYLLDLFTGIAPGPKTREDLLKEARIAPDVLDALLAVGLIAPRLGADTYDACAVRRARCAAYARDLGWDMKQVMRILAVLPVDLTLEGFRTAIATISRQEGETTFQERSDARDAKAAIAVVAKVIERRSPPSN